jgi:hypothetical protein
MGLMAGVGNLKKSAKAVLRKLARGSLFQVEQAVHDIGRISKPQGPDYEAS